MEVPVVVEAASIAVRQRLERLESDLEVGSVRVTSLLAILWAGTC